MYKSKTNPWFTVGYALLQTIFVIGWGYWTVDAFNQENWFLMAVYAICVIGCFSKAIKLLLRANAEAAAYYRKVND
jgi:hypothetical protein